MLGSLLVVLSTGSMDFFPVRGIEMLRTDFWRPAAKQP
jgi:hypothetical protein